ncbi:MAG: hypothetical protein ABEJ65_09925 [bacterium]
MGYKRRVLECHIDGWKIEQSGQMSDHPLTVLAELIYPRPLISLRKYTLNIPHRIGEQVSWSDQPFHRRIMFKEVVEGPFSIGITVKRGRARGIFQTIFPSMVQEAGKEGLEELLESVNEPAVSAALEVMGEVGFERLFSAGEKEDVKDVIATGVVELNSAEEAKDNIVEVPVKAPVEIPNPEPNPHPEKHSDYEEVLKEANENNGTVQLQYSVFER